MAVMRFIAFFVAVGACSDASSGNAVSFGSKDSSFEDMVGGSLFSTHGENILLKNHALAKELERTLKKLPGVEQARVHLSLADRSMMSRDRQEESRAAILIVPEGASQPDLDAIKRFAAAAVPTLASESVTVLVGRADRSEPTVDSVGPFDVSSGSATGVRIALSAFLCLSAFLAAGLIFAGYKLRKLGRRQNTSNETRQA